MVTISPQPSDSQSDPIQWALQIQVNPDSPSAYWEFDDEFGPTRSTLDQAHRDLAEAVRLGYPRETLRIVSVAVVS